MKKKFATASLIIMIILFVAGFVLVFSAGSFGEQAGTIAIQSHGGSMDTSAFERVISAATLSYQISGGILALVGGFGLLLSGFALYREM